MRTIPIALQDDVQRSATTFCEIIKFVRADGQVFAYTDHDRGILFGGVRYKRVLGVNLSDLEKTADMSVGNHEAFSALDAVGITQADIIAGRWDQAYWERRSVNWKSLGSGSILIDTGYTGKVSLQRNAVTIELLDLLQFLQAGFIDLITPRCRARLGDEWCTVDLAPFTVTGTLTDGDPTSWSAADFVGRAEAGGWFNRGKFTFTSGLNIGIAREVKEYDGGLWTFQLPFPFEIMAGDGYEAIAGCDGAHDTCRDKFDNIVNRQAEDFVAGDDQAIQVGRSQ